MILTYYHKIYKFLGYGLCRTHIDSLIGWSLIIYIILIKNSSSWSIVLKINCLIINIYLYIERHMLNIVYVFVNSCVIYTVTPIYKASIIILLPVQCYNCQSNPVQLVQFVIHS